MTFNVLHSPRHRDRIQTPARRRAILAHLEAEDADLIGLQEVCAGFLEEILAANWIRQGYALSDASGDTLAPQHGQLLCTRLPWLGLWRYDFSLHKRAVVAELGLGLGQGLKAAVVHLTSSRGRDAPRKRARQLEQTLKLFADHQGPGLLMGDFNSGTRALAPAEAAGFVDAWRALRPQEPGYTFDIERNGLAALMGQEGERRRFDRILTRV